MAELPDQVTVDKIIKIETDDLRVPNRVKFHVSSGGRETVLRFKDRDLDTSTVFERKVQAYLDQWDSDRELGRRVQRAAQHC